MLKFIRGKGQQPTAERQKLQKDLFAFRKVGEKSFPFYFLACACVSRQLDVPSLWIYFRGVRALFVTEKREWEWRLCFFLFSPVGKKKLWAKKIPWERHSNVLISADTFIESNDSLSRCDCLSFLLYCLRKSDNCTVCAEIYLELFAYCLFIIECIVELFIHLSWFYTVCSLL